MWVPVFIAIGIGSYFSINFEPIQSIAWIITLISILRVYSDYKSSKNYLLFIPVFLIALGFSAAQLRTNYMTKPMLYKKTKSIILEAEVADIEAMPKGEHRVVLDNVSYEYKTQDRMPTRIRIKLKKGKHYVPYVGETIKLRAVLMPLASPVLPNAFDFQRYAFFKGFYATGYAMSDAEVIKKDKDNLHIFPSMRRYLREHIKAGIKDSDKAAIVIALLDGEDRDISSEVTEIVRKAGIAHLMAISGLQVALVTGFFFFLVRYALSLSPKLALHLPTKKIAAFIAMLGAIFYMLLIGEAVSAERSVIMMCIFMLAIMFDREPFTLRVAAFASTIMLLYQPEILFGASFQLSFSAVIALIAFYDVVKNKLDFIYNKNTYYMRLISGLLAVTMTTLIATIAVLPFSLFHFLRTSTFTGLVANVIAVPLSSFVTLPVAIIASFLMPLSLEGWFLDIAAWSVEIILNVAAWVAKWNWGTFCTNSWSIWQLIAIAIGGLWLCIWQGKLRLFGLIPIAISFAVISFIPRADILIADEGNVYAVRDSLGKLFFSEQRKQKFIREKWQEMEGDILEESYYWDDENSPIQCDAYACIYKYEDKIISFVKEQQALIEDCSKADIIISKLEINKRACTRPEIIIDKKELLYKDAHIIYKDWFTKEIKVKSSGDVRGRRPWVVY